MKKIISLILSLSIIFSIFSIVPLNVSAETKAKSEENIYYSDLFYKYSHYLNDDYIDNYNTSCQGILYRVYEDYLNSPMYIFSDIKQALPAVFDLKEFTKAISDLTGLTNFSYEKALDRANQEFANELMGGCTIADKYSTQSEWFENINKFLKVYDTFEQNFTVYKKTEIEIYEETFQYFIDNSAFLHISITNIEMVKKIVLPKITEISDMLSIGSDVLEGAKVMMLALMIEDMRACIIDEVLKYQSRNTTLYDGMTRLKKQLSDGFATYFCYNYLDNQVLKLVSENVQKKLLGNTVIGNPVFAIIGAIVDVACFVVFDVIFDVPDIDDLTTQAILSMYANDFYSLICDSRTKFYTQFSNDDIHTFETLFTAFQAATNAAFKASEKITLSSNRDDFNSIKSVWYRKSIYTNYINKVKATVKSIPMDSRKVTNYDVWEISDTIYLRNPSDVIKADEIYFGDNFKVNITLDGNQYKANLIIPSDEEIKIDGNVELYSNAILDVYGKLTVNNLKVGYSYNINNNNEIIVKNNLNLLHPRATITQSDEAKLYVGGSFTNYNSSKNIKGTIIFNGATQQEIRGLNAYNVEVTNKEGIKYLSDSSVYGNYKLNGNPLDNNSFSTYIYEDISFDQISDYKKLVVENTLNLKSSVKGDITLAGNSYKANLIIPSDEEIKIDGSVELYSGAILEVDGKLTVNNLKVDYSYNIINNNEIIVKNNLNLLHSGATITQSDDAKLYVGGSFTSYNSSKNIKGTIIFNGATKQEISGLNAYNVEVTNKEGIKYLSDSSVYGNYKLNGNPLDNNGYNTYIYDGISFDQVSDYKKLVVENNLNLKSSVKGDITLDGNSYKANLIIPSDEEIKIDGDIDLYDSAILEVDGKLTVNNLKVDYSYNIINNNEIIVKNNLNILNSGAKITQSDDAKLYVGGSFNNSNSYNKIKGTIIFNGTQKQDISTLSAETIVIENESKEGIIFGSVMSASVLFNHKGNNFTLYNNGVGSTFVDYDTDGLNDNVDPIPTLYNPFGDVDCDGLSNASDLVSIRKILLNKEGMNNTQKLASDVNRDGNSNLRDLVHLKKKLAEIVN